MKRYWVSWWSGNYESEGCKNPPFKVWVSGSRDRKGDGDKDDLSMCAVIDAPSEQVIKAALKKYYPDMEDRFCERVAGDWAPTDRFPGFDPKKTRIV